METAYGLQLRQGLNRLLLRALLGFCAMALSGCGTLHSARVWFPKISGLDEINPHLYVEPVMSANQRRELQQQIEMGRATVDAFFGSVIAQPYFIACQTSTCDERFGSYGQRAAAYGDFAIRLSAKGQSAPLIAHEWSHAEVFRRAGGLWQASKIPRWFDEGLAVVIADEPRHSEENWRNIRRRGLPTPELAELTTFGDWGRAVQKYGETAGDVPENLHVVYTTAGHAVRAFLSCTGKAGVINLLDLLRSGANFESAYASVGGNNCANSPFNRRPT